MNTDDRVLHRIVTAVLFILAIIMMIAGALIALSNRQTGFILFMGGTGILGISISMLLPEKSEKKVYPEKNDRFQFR